MIKIMLKTVNDQNTLLEEDVIKNHTVIHGPSFHEGSQLVYKKKKNWLSSKALFCFQRSLQLMMGSIPAVKRRVKQKRKKDWVGDRIL